MGLYSLYKIIKDVVRSILGNKAWRYTLIVALIVLIFTLYSTKVSAADLRPWNVYNNTTEFNWSRLTNLNFVSGSIPYKLYEIKPEQTYYLYNPNSNNGTIHYFCYSSNDVDKPQVLIEDTSYNAALHLDYNFELPSGYVDIPYNTLFTPQMTFYVFITDSCELYIFDDKYSNIETYNELSALATDLREYLYGEDLQPLDFSNTNNLLATYNGTFSADTNYKTLYFPVKTGFKYSISYDRFNTTYNSQIRYGYCSSVPSVGSAYDTFTAKTSGFSATNNVIEFNSSSDTYYYISYSFGTLNNFSVKSNWVADMGGGINQQIINQGTETRETLTDSSISQNSSDYSLPTDSTNDVTQDGFGSIFDRIRATFTSGSATPITITIPFTGKSFTISKQSVFGSANLGIVGTIIQSFWWFVVSLFIVKDIFKKIEAIKSGNIEFAETTNIKEDIL